MKHPTRADNVAAAAEEMSANLNNVAAAMEESATNTSMVATAAEEMTATINEIAQNAEKARGIADQAVHKAGDASGQMDVLGKAAIGIGKVVETITEISEQVNLLALNATIEAAPGRRGRQGLCRGGQRDQGTGQNRPRPRPWKSRTKSNTSRAAPT